MKATNVPTAAGVINFNRFLRFSTKNNCIKNNFDELVMVTPIQLKSNIYPEENKNQQIGTPLLIIHGLFGHKQNWKSTAKAIQVLRLRFK
jgi:hypothetical protein